MSVQVLTTRHCTGCRSSTPATASSFRGAVVLPGRRYSRQHVKPAASYGRYGGDHFSGRRYGAGNIWGQAADTFLNRTLAEVLQQIERDFGVSVEKQTKDDGRTTTYTATPATEGSTPIDRIETDDDIVFYLDVPGLDKKDLKIQVNQSERTLTVGGERVQPVSAEDDTTARNSKTFERRFGKFSRSLPLPETADPQLVSAKVDRGVLRIKVLKYKELEKEPIIEEVKID